MKESRVRFSSMFGRSCRGARIRSESCGNPADDRNTSPARTPRRYKPTSLALLNKTLRTVTPTKIPRPSFQRTAELEDLTSTSTGAANPPDLRMNTENYGALPSSYRRIRKAKSMQSPRRHALSSQESPLSKPLHGGRTLRNATSFATLPISNLHVRLKQSLPFLRSKSASTRHPHSYDGSGSHEEAIHLARAQFLDEIEYQGVRDMSLRSNGMKLKIHRRPFRNSVRTSLLIDPSKSPSAQHVRGESPQSDRAKRSFSSSVRDRLRKALGMSIKGKESIPPQQLEAQRSHFRELEDYGGAVSGFDSYLIEDKSQGTRQSVYRPANIDQDALEDLDKIPLNLRSSVSRESLHSNSRSRVTSWTNSSTTGSIGLRSGLIERNRLSIIKEDGGPHQPSSSAGRHIGGVEVFHEPLQSITTDGQPLPSVDSRRVYSALIKRISQEDAEVERTRVALEIINQKHEKDGKKSAEEIPTIRTVHSNSSLMSAITDTHKRQFGSGSGSCHQIETKKTPEQHKEIADKRKERLADQECQSSFFPFSGESNPSAPSPFKKFLHDRRGRQRKSGNESESDNRSVIINRQPSNTVMNRSRFGFSSESIYSRTTNGGVNEQYRSPMASSEEVFREIKDEFDGTGMATIIPATYVGSNSGSSTAVSGLDDPKLYHSPWNVWSDTPVQLTGPEESSRGTHTREKAQMNSDESSKEAERPTPSEDHLRSATTDLESGRPPLLDLKFMSGGNTQKSKGLLTGSKSHAELLTKGSVDALSNISNNAEDGSKTSGSLRKLSSGNLSQILKGKSQVSKGQQDAGKENNPTDQQASPPLSTPGRLHLQFRYGASNGKLRKRASETAFNSRKGIHATPHCTTISTTTTPSRSEESPSEKAKEHLVSRLSRPFNMDVPPHNRPFDSMYLGKRTPGHPDAFGNSRLSVAPHVSPTHGGSRADVAQGSPNVETTALPSASSSAGTNTSKVLSLFSSKRMVSNFLKTRRGERSTSEGSQSVMGGEQAFI